MVQTHSDDTRSPASPRTGTSGSRAALRRRWHCSDSRAAEHRRAGTADSRAGRSAPPGWASWQWGCPYSGLTRRWGGQTAAAAEVDVSFPTGVRRRRRRRRRALSVQVMIASCSCARVFPALPVGHLLLQEGVAGFHRGVGAAGADLPVEPIRPLFFGGADEGVGAELAVAVASAPRCPSARGG